MWLKESAPVSLGELKIACCIDFYVKHFNTGGVVNKTKQKKTKNKQTKISWFNDLHTDGLEMDGSLFSALI